MNNDAKEEVRSRLAIEDVVGEYMQLKRAGRNFKGLSPFTSEKTPSFFVSPDKNIWHDFSSGKGGDVFAFVMEAEGMDFRQALEHLARKAGVDLSLYESKGSQEIAQRKRRALAASEEAAKYYQHSLASNKTALAYILKKRGFDQAVFDSFKLGYAPDSGNALTEYLIGKRGFTKKELNDAGLLNRRGTDLFRGRMMVPLMDTSGQVIGFTGRIIRDVPNAPKYLNTPQTFLYDKSRHVFGLSQAKEAIRMMNQVVVVEGNLDVVSSHQFNVKNVVATAGTAMTEYHLRAFKRLTSDVRLAYDGDKAGVAATERAIALASVADVELKIISLPDEFNDPDEVVRSDPELWREAIEQAQPAVDWVLAQYAKRVDLGTAAGKRAFTSAGLTVVKALHDPVEREHYERKIAEWVGTSLDTIQEKLEQTKDVRQPLKHMRAEKTEPIQETLAYQDDLLAVTAVDAPSQELLTHLDVSMLGGENRQRVARYLATHHGKVLAEVPKELQSDSEYVNMVLLRAETRYAEWDERDRYFETARLIRHIENEHKKQTLTDLTTRLRDAEEEGNEAGAAELRVQVNQLIKEIARGRR